MITYHGILLQYIGAAAVGAALGKLSASLAFMAAGTLSQDPLMTEIGIDSLKSETFGTYALGVGGLFYLLLLIYAY